MSPGFGSPTFSSLRIDTTVTASAIGSTAAKISRHEPSCSSTPETAGPSAGATDMASVTLPITRPRSCTGTTVISVVISSGIITAVPLAWMIRAINSTQNVGATSASAVPIENVIIAVAKAVRVVTRCRNQPVTGITDAIVNRNAVESHWAAFSDTSKCSARLGIALIMIVSLRITVNVAATSHRMTTGVRPVSAGAGAGAVMGGPWESQVGLMPGETGGGRRTHRVLTTILYVRAYSGPNEYCGVAE